jgi:hypothetical protein
MKVGDAANEVRKDVLQTEAQQKLLRGMMKAEFDRTQKDLKEGEQPEETE